MRRAALPALAAALLLAGCATVPGPRPQAGDVTLPETFLFAATAGEAASLAALLPNSDPAFTALSAAALAGAPQLAEALARVDLARAQAAEAGANRAPELGYQTQVAGSRANPEQTGGFAPRERASFGANLVASWDPDLFGALRASARAAQRRLDAASADAAAVRLALVGEVAAGVIDWRTLAAREAAASGDLTAARELARLAGERERAGIAPGFDRVRSEATIAASEARLAALAGEQSRLIARLSALTARPAGAVRAMLLTPATVGPPAPAPAALPSQLLRNRPDLAAAAARLAAANADVAAAAAQRFPRLDLSASLGLLAFGLDRLFTDEATVGTLAAGIAGPLLDFGRVQARIDAADAQSRITFAGYRRAVFTALGESEAAFATLAEADREAAASRQEADRATRAAAIALTRNRAGLSSFLEVLDARRAAEAAQDRAADAAGRAARARVVLWQALGGSAVAPGPA
jgi:NodT family efflux transporter outer membrane factor (OMF) lipoprotein